MKKKPELKRCPSVIETIIQEREKASQSKEGITHYLHKYFIDNDKASEGEKAVAQMIVGRFLTCPTQFVFFTDKNIDAGSLEPLCFLLSYDHTIKYLSLRDNNLGNEGATRLAEALKSNNCLTILDVSDNGIGQEGADSIIAMLEANNTLQIINLQNNLVHPAQLGTLSQKLEQNKFHTSMQTTQNFQMSF